MAAFAMCLYLVSLALVFGWRTLAQWRATGDTGLRLEAGPAGSVTWWAKLLFVTALLLGAAGPAAGLAGLEPVAMLDHTLIRAGGLVLTVIGVTATLAAQFAMGASWRIGVDPDERTALVTTGPFALTRNPIFTAVAASGLGIAAMVPNVVSLAAAVAFVSSIELQVRAVEEPYLVRTHGGVYTAYAARVGRFWPGVGRLRA